MAYEQLFARNLGVFSAAEQQRLRQARVLIVGCGGIGGLAAVLLARTGVEGLTLIDFDSFEPSNANRQIGASSRTFGRNKAEVLREEVLAINPAATVAAHGRRLSHADLAALIPEHDLVFPAADDFAFSARLFTLAQEAGRTSLFVLPAGAWAAVSLVRPDSPDILRFAGGDAVGSYEELAVLATALPYRLWTWPFLVKGGWHLDWYRAHLRGERPLAQIAPTVWLATSLGVLEAVKHLMAIRTAAEPGDAQIHASPEPARSAGVRRTCGAPQGPSEDESRGLPEMRAAIGGRWRPVVFPAWFEVSPRGVRRRRLGLASPATWTRLLVWPLIRPGSRGHRWLRGR